MSVLSQRSFSSGPITRFAPSPTGHLHLGHAYAACYAADIAYKKEGRFGVRIEDIDQGRCRKEFEDSIFEDLAWLGLTWETPIMRQSERLDAYADALSELREQTLLYPCFCTRKDIRQEIDRAGAAPHGPDGPLYPGTCRSLSSNEAEDRIKAGDSYALRLNMAKAVDHVGALHWTDEKMGKIEADPSVFGDVVLARKDSPTSYHLAVTIDDHAQAITYVTRGEDLFPSTHVHRLLQALLGLTTPVYDHHRLLLNRDGKKFSKRDTTATLKAMRSSGMTPDDVFSEIGLTPAL